MNAYADTQRLAREYWHLADKFIESAKATHPALGRIVQDLIEDTYDDDDVECRIESALDHPNIPNPTQHTGAPTMYDTKTIEKMQPVYGPEKSQHTGYFACVYHAGTEIERTEHAALGDALRHIERVAPSPSRNTPSWATVRRRLQGGATGKAVCAVMGYNHDTKRWTRTQ